MGRDATFAKHPRQPRQCRVCGNENAVIANYNLNICRRCFRENAEKIGFVKYH